MDAITSSSRAPWVVIGTSTVGSGTASLGASVAYMGRTLFSRRRIHDPVVAAGAPALG